MKEAFKQFLNKPQIKNVLLGVLVLIIGAVCSSLGTWENIDRIFIIKSVIIFILLIFYIGLLIFYSTCEVNERKVMGILKSRDRAFKTAMSGIIKICKDCSTDINTTIHTIIDEGKINLKIWSFDKACNSVCCMIYSLLCSLDDKSNDNYAVSYVKLIEDSKPETTIVMNSFANKSMHKPSIFGIKRDIDEKRRYYDAELFKRNKSDPEILIDGDEINNAFEYAETKDRSKNKGKYSQYIGIPVFCNDEKMVGLLEIVCLHGTKLALTETEVLEIAIKYLVPYSYLILLLHKLEKALLAMPKEKGRGKIDEK